MVKAHSTLRVSRTPFVLVAAVLLLFGAQSAASCSGGPSLSGSYGVLINGNGNYYTGVITFDGNCNVTSADMNGGPGGAYANLSAIGTYGQNADGTFTINLNYTSSNQNEPSTQSFVVGVSESGNKARGIESDDATGTTIDLQSQLNPPIVGYANTSLSGTYAASCHGNEDALNYFTFDGKGNITGSDYYNNSNGVGNATITGKYVVNTDGTFSGTIATNNYSFSGVIDNGIAEIKYTYEQYGYGFSACVGKPAASNATLSGYFGFVVGGTTSNAGQYLSGSLNFDGVSNFNGANIQGGLNGQYGTTSATGSFVVNSDNTLSLTLNLAGQSSTQTFVVAVSTLGDEAVGIETDGSALATIDLQNQLWPSSTPPYTVSSLNGTYAASCYGTEVDLNWVTFDGNGNQNGIDPYYAGFYGSSPYTGTYTVNSDGTFSGGFAGIYSEYTMTGVIDNTTGEIEYTYDLAGTGGVVQCFGESTYGPVGSNPAAATPTFSPTPGSYTSSQSISLSDSTPGAVIYYTTNGMPPTTNSAVYSTPIPVSANITLQAIAVASGYNNSAINAGAYYVSGGLPVAATPTFNPLPGSYNSAQSVTLSDTTTNAVIYYTTDGSTPSTSSPVYSGSIPVNATMTIHAIAVAPGYTNSAVGGGVYTISLQTVATPTLNPAPGSYTSAQSVTLSDTTSGATIYYTTDGTTPSTASAVYTVPIAVNATTTIYAIAAESGYTTSAVNGGTYTITLNQTINFAPIANQVYPATVSLNATASSGLPVSFSIVSGPATLNGNTLTTTGTGTVTVKATQAGNSQYAAATPVQQSFVVNTASTTLTLVSNTNPSYSGQQVTFTATITPQAGGQTTGTIAFKDGATTLSSVQVSGNAANLTTSALAIGTHSITAAYSGDSNFIGSVSSTVSQVVNKATTNTTLTSSVNPSVAGKIVTFTATVTSPAGTPTGTIIFVNGATTLAKVSLKSGSATYSTTKLPAGSNSITAIYNGDTNNANATSAALNQQVLATSTTVLKAAPSPSAYLQTVNFTATVNSSVGVPADGELVTFEQGSTVLGTAALANGSATWSTNSLAVGSHAIKAIYAGDTNIVTSTSALVTEVVAKAPTTTTLASSLNPAPFGQSVTFTATISPEFGGNPTGLVTFKDGTKTLGSVVVSGGTAAYTTSRLARGAHNITATYGGSSSFATSTSTAVAQTIQ